MRLKHQGEILPGALEKGEASEQVVKMSDDPQLEGLKVLPPHDGWR